MFLTIPYCWGGGGGGSLIAVGSMQWEQYCLDYIILQTNAFWHHMLTFLAHEDYYLIVFSHPFAANSNLYMQILSQYLFFFIFAVGNHPCEFHLIHSIQGKFMCKIVKYQYIRLKPHGRPWMAVLLLFRQLDCIIWTDLRLLMIVPLMISVTHEVVPLILTADDGFQRALYVYGILGVISFIRKCPQGHILDFCFTFPLAKFL